MMARRKEIQNDGPAQKKSRCNSGKEWRITAEETEKIKSTGGKVSVCNDAREAI